MCGGGAGDAGFARLGGHVHLHPERVAQPARLHGRAHAAELDGLQAHAARRPVRVIAADVRERMDAFVGADRDVAGRSRDRCHSGDIVGVHGLLEEIEPGTCDRVDILQCFDLGPALVGIGGDQHIIPEPRADLAGALGIGERRIDADLDLEGGIAFGLLLLRLAQVGGERAGADDAEDRHTAALLAAEQRISRLPGGAADDIMQRHFDRRLGRAIAVHAVSHRRHGAGDIFRGPALDRGQQIVDRCHHALDRLAGHGRRRGGFAPADHAVVRRDAHQHVVGLADLDASHEHRLRHRQADRDRLDTGDVHDVLESFGFSTACAARTVGSLSPNGERGRTVLAARHFLDQLKSPSLCAIRRSPPHPIPARSPISRRCVGRASAGGGAPSRQCRKT